MAGGDHLVDGFHLCRLPGGFAPEAGGGDTREFIADEEMVKRLIVEMVGIIPSLQKMAERLGFFVAGQRERFGPAPRGPGSWVELFLRARSVRR